MRTIANVLLPWLLLAACQPTGNNDANTKKTKTKVKSGPTDVSPTPDPSAETDEELEDIFQTAESPDGSALADVPANALSSRDYRVTMKSNLQDISIADENFVILGQAKIAVSDKDGNEIADASATQSVKFCLLGTNVSDPALLAVLSLEGTTQLYIPNDALNIELVSGTTYKVCFFTKRINAIYGLIQTPSVGAIPSGYSEIETVRNPVALAVNALSSSSLKVTWEVGSANTESFVVTYQKGETAPTDCLRGTRKTVESVDGENELTVQSLSADSAYAFRICGAKSGLDMSKGSTIVGNTEVATVSVPLALLQAFSARNDTVTSDGEIDLSLTLPDDVTGYNQIKIARRAGKNPPNANCSGPSDELVTQLANFDDQSVALTDSAASPGVVYIYRACVVDATGAVKSSKVTAGVKARGHRIFATSTTYDGNLGGLAGADAKCQSRADDANLGGTWRAILSTSTKDARDRVTTTGALYNMSGTKVADPPSRIFDTYIYSSFLASFGFTEFGGTPTVDTGLGGYPSVWTGSDYYGRHVATRSCNNWTSNLSSYTLPNVGSLDGSTGSGWLWIGGNSYTFDCSVGIHIVCMIQ